MMLLLLLLLCDVVDLSSLSSAVARARCIAKRKALFFMSPSKHFPKEKKVSKTPHYSSHYFARKRHRERERERRRRRRTRDARPRIDDDGNTYNGHRRWRRRRRRTAPRRAFTGRLERCPRRDAAKILQRGEARRDRKVQDAPVRQR